MKLKIVAVVGGHAHVDMPVGEFGAWLAGRRVHLLTGGGSGVMSDVAEGFTREPRPDGHGLSIGVIPGDKSGHPKSGYPNAFVEIVIRTHLHGQANADGSGGGKPKGDYSRNHINALSADVMVAFPGGPGTYAEITLARKLGKPILAFVPRGTTIDEHDASALRGESIAVVESLAELQSSLIRLLQ
jgi:predicted Rossmann-fold nucleotide-binding protein